MLSRLCARVPGMVTVRGRTLAGGLALAAMLLAGLTLVGSPVLDHPEPPPPHAGPLTATQPELREALLAEDDVLDAPPTTAPAVPPAPTSTTTAAPPPAPSPAGDQLEVLCRALFEDPARLGGLLGAAAPTETSARYTRPRGGALRQVLSSFEAPRAIEAYREVREVASGCQEFTAAMDDGTVVTVLLEELAAGRRDSRRESLPIDETYEMTMTVRTESGTRSGWLALDRVGPVVSVLRQLGPDDRPAEPGTIRRAALQKLRSVLRLPGDPAELGEILPHLPGIDAPR